MRDVRSSKLSSGGNFNTLAQNGTNINSSPNSKQNIIVFGKGTDRKKTNALNGRAKRKTITQKLMLALIDVANEEGAKDRLKSYWNTYHCQSRIVSSSGRIHGSYCKNSFCNICNSIRKAEIINKYYPIVSSWESPQFVTLTVKSVHAPKLYKHVRTVKKKFNQIIELQKKRHQRGKGIKPIGIVSLECNFNPKDKTYNPHFHILVPNIEIAYHLLWEWRKKWPKGHTNIWAQKIRKVGNTETDMIETIKYGAKIFTSPDMKKKSRLSPIIYAKALDHIYASFKGIHLFSSFGFTLNQVQNLRTPPKLLLRYEEWRFEPCIGNWVEIETGEILSNYQITAELKLILEQNIDTSIL